MPEAEFPTATLDLCHPSNCINEATARAGKAIRVLVRSEDGPTTELTEAMGTLSNDGKVFAVVVTREDGTQPTHGLRYRDVLKALSDID